MVKFCKRIFAQAFKHHEADVSYKDWQDFAPDSIVFVKQFLSVIVNG